MRASRVAPLDARLGNVSLIPLRGSENEMRNSVAAFTADPLAVSQPINQSGITLRMTRPVSPAHLEPILVHERECSQDVEKSPSLQPLAFLFRRNGKWAGLTFLSRVHCAPQVAGGLCPIAGSTSPQPVDTGHKGHSEITGNDYCVFWCLLIVGNL